MKINVPLLIMKKQLLLLLGVLLLFLISCSTNIAKDQTLYANAWELEYITGPRITFQGLFPDMKPKIQFTAGSDMITGNSGCNGYSTRFTLQGNMISFADPELSTMMYCGDGEAVFRKTMKQIDRYRLTDGKLEFLMGDVVMMRFKPAL
ncbi:MAG: META domain-containing protein [Flavobacteriia bacterium]|nr:META domain-containing protein [Flavobacteriia bacterium]